MTTPQPESGYQVTLFRKHRRGSLEITVSYLGVPRWFVSISRDGSWDVENDLGEPPDSVTLKVIMITVSNYALRKAFGGRQ